MAKTAYEKKVLTANYEVVDFGVAMSNVLLIVSGAACNVSLNGADDFMELEVADTPILLPSMNTKRIWLKGTGATVRVSAWIA